MEAPTGPHVCSLHIDEETEASRLNDNVSEPRF